MATGYRLGLLTLFFLISQLEFNQAQQVITSGSVFTVSNRFALVAEPETLTSYRKICNGQFNSQQNKQSTSIETLIDFIQKLEDFIYMETADPVYQNFRTPDMVARMILQRFNLDSFRENKKPDENLEIDTAILGRTPNFEASKTYNFPDGIYQESERCTFYEMLSHDYINLNNPIGRRNTRDTSKFPFSRNNFAASNSPFLDNSNANNNMGNTRYENNNMGNTRYETNNMRNLNNMSDDLRNVTREVGVVSFRMDNKEAIAIARVLYGIIAAFVDKPNLSGTDIVKRRNDGVMADPSEANLKDAVLAVTFGSLVGRAVYQDNPTSNQGQKPVQNPINLNLAFGLSGQWINSTCQTYYSLDRIQDSYWSLIKSIKGSLAEIRGATDGYIIGKSLQSSINEAKSLKLSTILKNYYSPRGRASSTGLKVNYCDRATLKPQNQDLNDVIEAYGRIYKYYIALDQSALRKDLFMNFQMPINSNFCQTGGGTNNQMCETPTDLLFVVDGRDEFEWKSAMFIQQMISKIPNIGRYGAAISVFTSGKNNVQSTNSMNIGSWPFGILAFNSTNIGSLTCSITPEIPITSQNNFAKYLQDLNTTLTQYKWWSLRGTLGGVPSRNVILLSLGKMQASTSGQESTDIDTYRKALKYRARDVRFLVVTPQKELYQDMVRDDKWIVTENNMNEQLASEWTRQVCNNPATLQYNNCRDSASNNFSHSLWITPGYTQHWVVYPEYFRRSETLDFSVSAVDGDISVCWDRYFPGDITTNSWHEVNSNSGYGFRLENPCKGENVHSCKPIYITIKGKQLQKPFCNERECQNLDQIKVSITHTGMRCGAMSLTVSFVLTIIFSLIPNILNRLF